MMLTYNFDAITLATINQEILVDLSNPNFDPQDYQAALHCLAF